jgi:anti-sigma regulatory factor (Ser/Thr protein kinase)
VTSALPGSDPACLVIAELDALAEPSMRVFPGDQREVRKVRAFVGAAVDGCPAADDVILLASEVATNAILHTASGNDGKFKVIVHALDGMVRVEVHDGGSETLPGIGPADDQAVSGRGLGFVEELATRWGHLGDRDGRVVWFEVEWQ